MVSLVLKTPHRGFWLLQSFSWGHKNLTGTILLIFFVIIMVSLAGIGFRWVSLDIAGDPCLRYTGVASLANKHKTESAGVLLEVLCSLKWTRTIKKMTRRRSRRREEGGWEEGEEGKEVTKLFSLTAISCCGYKSGNYVIHEDVAAIMQPKGKVEEIAEICS